MSKYTTSIYNILQNIVPDGYNKSVDVLVSEGAEIFFDFDFPWYTDDVSTKTNFMREYLYYYINNEIGQETLEMHKQCIRRVLIENMESMQQKYTLLSSMPNVAGEKTISHQESTVTNESGNANSEQTNTNTATQNIKSDEQSIHSDNPQITFGVNDYASSMERGETKQQTSTNNSGNTVFSSDTKRNENGERNFTESEVNTRDNVKLFNAIQNGVYLINTELILKCRRLYMQVW